MPLAAPVMTQTLPLTCMPRSPEFLQYFESLLCGAAVLRQPPFWFACRNPGSALDSAEKSDFIYAIVKTYMKMRKYGTASRCGDRPLPRARLLRAGPGDVGR